MLNRSLLCVSVFVVLLSLTAGSVTAQTTVAPNPATAELRAAAKPEALIAEFNEALLAVMRGARQLKYAGRREMLRKTLFDVYHLPVMARIAVGAHWRGLSPAQQATLVTHFSDLTLATYANRFSGWSGEKFEMRGVEPVRDKTVLVKTAIIRPNDKPVEINYLMRRFTAGWKVIDVFLKESYSELATKRSEYSSILRREGFDELIRQLDAKVAQYANTPD